MIPYFELREIQLGPLRIPVFSVLGVVALITGYLRGVGRAKRLGLNTRLAGSFGLTVILGALAGAVLFKLAYHPNPLQPQSWIERYRGIASFGGLFGGLAVSIVYLSMRGISAARIVRTLDVIAYVCPLAWSIGRLGCTLVHDHPGIRSDSWLAVRYPDWPRYDLGLLGMLFLLVLSALFAILDQQPRPPGFFLCVGFLLVGVFRLWMDRLQVDPPRYHGWTVDQVSSVVMLACGVTLIPYVLKRWKEEAT